MTTPQPSAISLRALRKRLGRTEVLRGLDLEVPAGSAYGFVGLNGAGKTTTIECLLGLLEPDGGEVSVLGSAPRELASRPGRVGVVFDSPCLHPSLTAREALEHARCFSGGRAMRSAELLGLLGLERYRDVKTRKLSLGNRRRLAIARALVASPELLVLDEPFSGLDAGGVDDVVALLSRLHRERGVTLVVSSHQLGPVESLATHVAVLHAGTIAAAGALGSMLASRERRIVVRVDSSSHALAVLGSMPRLRAMRGLDDERIEIAAAGVDPADVNAALVGAGVRVGELVVLRPSLADFFRQLTAPGPSCAA